jgi:hypothetical protein
MSRFQYGRLRARTCFLIAVLHKPLLALDRETRAIVKLPIGATVEFHDAPQMVGIVQIQWKGRMLLAFREDLVNSSCKVN